MEPTLNETAPDKLSRRLETLIQGQQEVFERMSAGAPLTSILEAITGWVEALGDHHPLASILLTDETGERLLHGAAPSLPADYSKAIHGISIGAAVGSCGTAAYARKPVIVTDIATDLLWEDYRDLALGFGLHACWSTPLINKDGKVLGTFAIYYKQPCKPAKDDLEIIKLVSQTAIIAIEYKKAEEERHKKLLNDQEVAKKIKREQQHFYRLLMHAPAMIAVLKGPEHTFELTNALYEQAVGYGRNLIGKTMTEALPEVVNQGIISILDQVYQTGETYIGDELEILLDRSGKGILEKRYFNFVYQPIKDETGMPEGIFVHAVDVTEHVNARKRAEASEERFRSFVMNAPMPIGIYTGREMRIQMVNDAILEAWGKDRSVVGKTFREALPELEGQPFYQLLDDVYLTGIPYQATEDRVDLMRNGKLEITYYNFTYKALKDSEGNIYGVINTAAEVTDLVRAKQKLAETQKDLAHAIELAELGPWSIDLQTNQVSYSRRVADWFGLEEEHANLRDVLAGIVEEDRERVMNAIEEAIATNTPYEAEYKAHNKSSNETRILRAIGRVFLDENGQKWKMKGIVQNMTLQRMTEQELERQVEARTIALRKANMDLQKVNDSLQQFVYIASHDLQEPLRKINMFSDILMQRNKNQLDGDGRKHLEKITDAAQRMSKLISDLLDFSRVGSKEKIFIPTNLEHILNDVAVDYELLIKEKDATVRIDCPLIIEAIPLQMNQLFYNLIGNALKFAKAGIPPEIHIAGRLLEHEEVLQYNELNGTWPYCEVIVQDNGIGFDQHFAEQIFTIFQRLHGKEKYEGTGIGLAICRKIVDNHDGIIFARSNEGTGTSFHVILPVNRN